MPRGHRRDGLRRQLVKVISALPSPKFVCNVKLQWFAYWLTVSNRTRTCVALFGLDKHVTVTAAQPSRIGQLQNAIRVYGAVGPSSSLYNLKCDE